MFLSPALQVSIHPIAYGSGRERELEERRRHKNTKLRAKLLTTEANFDHFLLLCLYKPCLNLTSLLSFSFSFIRKITTKWIDS